MADRPQAVRLEQPPHLGRVDGPRALRLEGQVDRAVAIDAEGGFRGVLEECLPGFSG